MSSPHTLSCKQTLRAADARFPDLFHAIDPDDLPTTLDTPSVLSIILSSASAYPSTASRLTSILDVPVPPAELSTQLIGLQPRIARVETLQATQSSELATLRQRSAAVLQRWYAVDVLRSGESWAEMESRVEKVERGVRRVELAKRLEDAMV